MANLDSFAVLLCVLLALNNLDSFAGGYPVSVPFLVIDSLGSFAVILCMLLTISRLGLFDGWCLVFCIVPSNS